MSFAMVSDGEMCSVSFFVLSELYREIDNIWERQFATLRFPRIATASECVRK